MFWTNPVLVSMSVLLRALKVYALSSSRDHYINLTEPGALETCLKKMRWFIFG